MLIKKFKVMSVAKVLCLFNAAIGLAVGVVATFSAVVGGADATNQLSAFGVFSIIVFPIAYGIGGFLGGAVTAFIYNIITSFVGGIEIES